MASSSETTPIGSALASSAARQSSPEKSKKISQDRLSLFFFLTTFGQFADQTMRLSLKVEEVVGDGKHPTNKNILY